MTIENDEVGTFGTSGAFDLDANWAVATPTTGAFIIRNTSQDLDANPDQSAHTFTIITIDGTYTGTIFSSGSPLLLGDGATPTLLRFNSGGPKAFIDKTIDRVLVNCPRALTSEQLVLGSSVASTYTDVEITTGHVTMSGANCTITNLWMSGLGNSSAFAVLGAGATVTNTNLAAGQITCNVALTTHKQSGGIMNHKTGTIATADISGGVFNLLSGTVTVCNGLAGEIHLDRLRIAANRITTLNLLNADVFLGPNTDVLDTMTINRRAGGHGRIFGRDGEQLVIS